jgi:hypothetical protein
MIRRLLLAIALVIVAASCGDDDASEDVIETTTSTLRAEGTTTSTTDGTTTSTTAFDGSTSATSIPGDGSGLLTEVRVGAEGAVERVVFEFRDALPGATLEYVEPPITQDGSGEPIEVAGDAFLQVVMTPATGYDFEANAESYTGPERVTGGTTVVQEVVRTGDFEGYLTWVIGLDREVPFRVLQLDGGRLVVELSTEG